MNKQITTILAATAVLAASALTSQAVLTMNFAGINDIQFNSASGVNSFQLSPTSANSASPQFAFNAPDATLKGWVTGGPWLVNYASLVSGGGVQTMNVTTGGQLNIWDGVNTLTGNVNWVTIKSYAPGTGGVANALAINLTSIAYSGSNARLQALASGGSGNINLSFQFSGAGYELTDLFNSAGNAGTHNTSYSGSISSIPEPSTVVAATLLLLPFGVSTLRILRKSKQC